MDISLSELRAFCQRTGNSVTVEPGGIFKIADSKGVQFATVSQSKICEWVCRELVMQPAVANFSAPGYEDLAAVLHRAFNQAAHGKGKERHANGEPFSRQVIQDMARRFGVGSLLGQAFKKSEESQRLPTDRAVNELLGSIVYLAAAVIALEAKAKDPLAYTPANDNARVSTACAGCKRGPEA